MSLPPRPATLDSRRRSDRIEIRSAFRWRKCVAALLLLSPLHTVAVGQEASRCGPGLTALVLSGGGARGTAHIGVLHAMEQYGVRPDLVVGTSIGALVGALYASGLSAAEIDSLATSVPADRLFGTPQPVPTGWGDLTPLVIWEHGDQGFSLGNPVVLEAETTALLNAMLLKGNLIARGNFDSLPIPFRAVVTDLATREPVILDHGDLARAVRASSAIPLVFTPVRMEGHVYADGGLSANVPIEVARQLGAARVIVSDVSNEPHAADELVSPLAVVEQLTRFLFTQARDSLGEGDVYIRPDVSGAGTLDFSRPTLMELIARGREAGDTVLASASCLPYASPQPRAFPRTVGVIEGPDLRPDELGTLRGLLGLHAGGTIEVSALARRFSRVAELDAYREVWLNPTGWGEGGDDSVDFRLEVVRAPRRVVGLDLAYDNALGGRMGFAGVDRAILGTGTEATGTLVLGRFVKEATAGIRHYYGVEGSRLAPTVTLQFSQIGVRRFLSDGVEVPEEETREGALFVGLERDLARWVIHAGLDGRVWRTGLGNDAGVGVEVKVSRPSRGNDLDLELDARWSGAYRSVQASIAGTVTVGRIAITPLARVGWGRHLPSHMTFALGGTDGFPGLHVQERRGDQEVYFSTRGRWTLRGPLTLVLEIAAGRVGFDGDPPVSDGWLGGVRTGLVAETPLGPIRAEYGVTTSGRGAVLIRVGRWF